MPSLCGGQQHTGQHLPDSTPPLFSFQTQQSTNWLQQNGAPHHQNYGHQHVASSAPLIVNTFVHGLSEFNPYDMISVGLSNRYSTTEALMRKILQPCPFLDNTCFFPYLELKMIALSVGKRMLLDSGEIFPSRKVSRKLSMTQQPANVLLSTDSIILPLVPLTGTVKAAAAGRKKREAPLVTSQVRRSNRTNKYDGFKPQQVCDSKATKSKVKPRKIPAVAAQTEDTKDLAVSEDIGTSSTPAPVHVPPETPIPVMQAIGVNLCGIPAAELSPKKFMASLQEEEESA